MYSERKFKFSKEKLVFLLENYFPLGIYFWKEYISPDRWDTIVTKVVVNSFKQWFIIWHNWIFRYMQLTRGVHKCHLDTGITIRHSVQRSLFMQFFTATYIQQNNFLTKDNIDFNVSFLSIPIEINPFHFLSFISIISIL